MVSACRCISSLKPLSRLAGMVRQGRPAGEPMIMSPAIDPSRDLLFGSLAPQIGLINQAQLVAAFQQGFRGGFRGHHN